MIVISVADLRIRKFGKEISCWIGLNDIDVEGKYVFDDGTKPTNYTNWQPNTSPESELPHCIHLQ
jgi:hypothetical protein